MIVFSGFMKPKEKQEKNQCEFFALRNNAARNLKNSSDS